MYSRSERLHRQTGYTLIEVLISVAILAVVFTMVSLTFAGTFRMVQIVHEEQGQERQARACLSFIAEDLMMARKHLRFPWSTKNGEREGQPADLLAFVSTRRASGDENRQESGLSRVVYTREGDRVSRFALRNLHGAIPEAIEQIDLMTDVVAFDLRYYDDTLRKWVDDWDGNVRKTLPRAVMIQLTVMNSRHERQTYIEWATISARSL
jgi:general secretion pathway protein J